MNLDTDNKEIYTEIEAQVNDLNARFSNPEQLKKFSILSRDFTIEDGDIRYGLLSIKGISDKSIEKLNKFRNKSGYRFTYENSIYIDPIFMNKGIGAELLKNLIKISKKNKKIKNIIAVIGDSKNYSSIKIHSKNGFKKIGILRKIAFKKNKWLDSVYMQKTL